MSNKLTELPIIPEVGKKYHCKLKHAKSGKVVEVDLVGADDEDCTWRTADDGSELNEWAYDVIEAVEFKHQGEGS